MQWHSLRPSLYTIICSRFDSSHHRSAAYISLTITSLQSQSLPQSKSTCFSFFCFASGRIIVKLQTFLSKRWRHSRPKSSADRSRTSSSACQLITATVAAADSSLLPIQVNQPVNQIRSVAIHSQKPANTTLTPHARGRGLNETQGCWGSTPPERGREGRSQRNLPDVSYHCPGRCNAKRRRYLNVNMWWLYSFWFSLVSVNTYICIII